jgi:hypothetical protein
MRSLVTGKTAQEASGPGRGGTARGRGTGQSTGACDGERERRVA